MSGKSKNKGPLHQLDTECNPPLESPQLKELLLNSLSTALYLPRGECSAEWYVWKQGVNISLIKQELKLLRNTRKVKRKK